jgi:hypothetical protein
LAEWLRKTLSSDERFKDIRIERKDNVLLFLHLD